MANHFFDIAIAASSSIITLLTAFFLILKSSKLAKNFLVKAIFKAVDEDIIANTPFLKAGIADRDALNDRLTEVSDSVSKIKESNAAQDGYLTEIKKNISELNKISTRLENSAMRSELINQLYYVISKKGKVPNDFWIHLCEKYDEYTKRGLNSNVSVLFHEASKYIVNKPEQD